MAEQKINAVEMTQRIRDNHYQPVRGLSREQRLAFYRERAALMNAKAAKLARAGKHVQTPPPRPM